jgi:hypothetical protein
MTTYPQAIIPAFLAGYPPVPSVMDGWAQQPLQFLTQRPVFRGIQQLSGGQALSSGTFDALQVGGTAGDILEDPYGGWSTVTTADQPAWSYLVPYTGLYEVTISVPIIGANIFLAAVIEVSGGTPFRLEDAQVISGIPGGCCGVLTVACTAGQDYIQAGTAVSGAATTDTTAAKVLPSLSIGYVSAG